VVQDGAAVGIFEIDAIAGELFFEVQHGAVELRGISVEELATRIHPAEGSDAPKIFFGSGVF